MSNFNNDSIVICEPTVSYSSSVTFSIGNTLGSKNHKVNKSMFTPLWKKNLPNKKIKHSKSKASYSVEKLSQCLIENISNSFKNKKNKRAKSLSDDGINSSNEKSTDLNNNILEQNYDELIEKLKRSPPQIKNKPEIDEEIDDFMLTKKDKNYKKQLSLDYQKINKSIFTKKTYSNPKKIQSLRRKSLQYQQLLNSEEKVKHFTNTENISDFYEYTERCLEIILELDKSNQIKLNEKVNLHFPKEESFKKIALFDLDETLAHCIGEIKSDMSNKKKYNHIVNVTLPSKKRTKIGINIRPHWEETMDLIKDKYQIVIYTASHQSYADAVLNYMDPQLKYTKYRLYRNNCVQANVNGKKFYIKDLDIFDKYYNLKDIIIIDNSVLSFAYHLNNGIPIVPYYDSEEDNELSILGYYLLSIYNYDDLREANKIHIRIDYYLEEAKKDMEEEEEDEDIIEEDDEYLIQIPENKENNIILLKDLSLKDKNNNESETTILYKNNSAKNVKSNIKEKSNVGEIRNKDNRTFTINNIRKQSRFGGMSPGRKSPKRKKTNNEGLNIFDLWNNLIKQLKEQKKYLFNK
jgi:Dullard-like phosphatase family protein